MKLEVDEDEETSRFVGVQLGEATTRSIKIMAFDSESFETPVELYHYKAKHGESEYREIGLSSDIYSDEDDGVEMPEYEGSNGDQLENYLDDDTLYF